MTHDLERMYREHRQGLYSLALAITGSPQLAEDAVHDAFARLYNQDSESSDNLRAYVFSAVRNAAIDIGRRTSTQRRTMTSMFNGFAAPTGALREPADDVLTAERNLILRQAVDALPCDDREIVLMKTFVGLTFEEIGHIVDAPLKTVASRYRRALAKLEQQLRGRV